MSIELAAAAFAFVAVTALLVSIFNASSGRRALEQRLGLLNRPAAADRIDASGVLRRSSSTFPALRRLLAHSSSADRAALDLQRAGLTLKVSEYFLLRTILAVVCLILFLLLIGGSAIGLIFSIVAGVVGVMLPAVYVAFLKKRRVAAIEGQLVEGLQLIANALRSGFAFTQAVEMAARQVQSPLKDELTRFLQDNALGARSDAALQALVERTGSYDVEMMVTTITVQRTTGGNLSEILDNVAETIRERERLQGEIKALTAQQRLTGMILSVLPVGLGLFFTILAPSLMKVLWQEELGRILLGIAIVLQALAFFTIGRILRLEV